MNQTTKNHSAADGAARTEDGHPAPYWYENDKARTVAVLTALRNYRAAEMAMRKRTRAEMKMNDNELGAIRFLLESERRGISVSPTQIAERLDISTASISTLLDRLERSGHVERRPHPTDGRGVVVVPTGATDVEVRHTLSAMHSNMMGVATALTPDQAETIIDFLEKMTKSIDTVDKH